MRSVASSASASGELTATASGWAIRISSLGAAPTAGYFSVRFDNGEAFAVRPDVTFPTRWEKQCEISGAAAGVSHVVSVAQNEWEALVLG